MKSFKANLVTLKDAVQKRTAKVSTSKEIIDGSIVKANTDVDPVKGAPTIFKRSPKKKSWSVSYDIKKIGCNSYRNDIDVLKYPDLNLPNFSIVKQVGSSVKEVHYLQLENDTINPELFKYATALKDVKSCFNDTKIRTIPEKLFANCKNLKIFSYCFSECKYLQEIPENLFANNKLTESFNGVFTHCEALTEIPENLFANNERIIDLSYAFSSCTDLVSAPKLWPTWGLSNFIQGFKDLFTKPAIFGGYCYYNCKELYFYDSIPRAWRDYA